MLLVVFQVGLQVLRVSLNVFFLGLNVYSWAAVVKREGNQTYSLRPKWKKSKICFAILEKITIMLSLTIHYSNFVQLN